MISQYSLRTFFPFVFAVLVQLVIGLTEMTKAEVDQFVKCSNDAIWMDNDRGQSPCTVAYFLMLQCAEDPNFAVLPLNESKRSYDNPLMGKWCSCNTVVYNLMSACAVCQGGFSADFSEWMDDCSDITQGYPDRAVAQSFNTPRWAYVDTTNARTFNVRAAKEAASTDDRGWTGIQIALPIIIGVVIAIIAGLAFFFYRRRLKRRYDPILGRGPYPSPPTQHMQQGSEFYSQQSIPRSRPGHQHAPSSSSLGLQSLTGRNSPAPRRKKSAVSVAWERARLHAPRKFGGLLPDRPKVHARTRSNTWSIDSDPEDLENGYNDTRPRPRHSRHGSSSGSGLHSKEASGSSGQNQHVKEAQGRGQERSESSLALLPGGGSPDGPELNRKTSKPNFVQGIVNGISSFGDEIRLRWRVRPVTVVSRSTRRGFNLDGEDSTGSPVVPTNVRASQHKSFVSGELQPDREPEPESEVKLYAASADLLATNQGAKPSQIPIQTESSGDRRQSDENSDLRVSTPETRSISRERGAGQDGVMLISRSPGQDFNSMASPVTTEEPYGVVFGGYSASTESNRAWPAALTDAGSTILLPSFAREQQVALPLPLPSASPPTQQTNSSRTNSPAHSAHGSPHAPPRLLIPGNTSSQQLLLVPPSIRAAGGYANDTHPHIHGSTNQTPPLAPAPDAAMSLSTTSLTTSPPILPNARLFSDTRSESVIPEPPSAISYVTAATTAMNEGGALASASENSSSHAYTVPNPFTFDARRGGSTGAANALRMASPPRPNSRPEIIE